MHNSLILLDSPVSFAAVSVAARAVGCLSSSIIPVAAVAVETGPVVAVGVSHSFVSYLPGASAFQAVFVVLVFEASLGGLVFFSSLLLVSFLLPLVVSEKKKKGRRLITRELKHGQRRRRRERRQKM